MLRNNIEKTAKIKDLRLPKPFQNSFKNLSKSMSQKTCDFSWICVRKMLRCTSADINFVLVFTVFCACRTLFLVSLFACIFNLKNLPKNEIRYLQKSMLKTLCFSISIFSRFGVDFGFSWASKIEPSWSFWLPITRGGARFEPS